MSTLVSLSLLLCLMAAAVTTVECYALKRATRSTVQLAASARPTAAADATKNPPAVSDLQVLDDVRTHVKLLDVSEDIRELKRMLDEFQKSSNSAWSPGLQTSIVLTSVVIAMATSMLAIY